MSVLLHSHCPFILFDTAVDPVDSLVWTHEPPIVPLHLESVDFIQARQDYDASEPDLCRGLSVAISSFRPSRSPSAIVWTLSSAPANTN